MIASLTNRFSQFVSPNRIGRGAFTIRFIILFLAQIIVYKVIEFIMPSPVAGGSAIDTSIKLVLMLAVEIAFLGSLITLKVARLHDCDLSWKWGIPNFLISAFPCAVMIAALAGIAASNIEFQDLFAQLFIPGYLDSLLVAGIIFMVCFLLGFLALGIMALLSFATFVVLIFLPGTNGYNKYGAPLHEITNVKSNANLAPV